MPSVDLANQAPEIFIELPKRFPPDFLFEINEEEIHLLVSQNVISSLRSLGGSPPLEWRQDEQAADIHQVFETIQHLIESPGGTESKRRIGFPAPAAERLCVLAHHT
ncbi:MAG TPA: hypothetical protein VK604_17440 [Bryobacteraceae bacterium]|nr:hypothetical protein [Bryobacteraceae bacterium]